MSASPIDALLQLTPAPRAAEPSLRGERDGRAFGPALERAYATEKAREAPARTAAEEEPVDAAPETVQGADDAEGGQTETAADRSEISPQGEAASDDADGSSEAEETSGDEVEVSELASVALAADEAQAALNAEEFAAAMLGGQAEEAQPTGDAKASSAEDEIAEGATKLAGKLSTLLSGDGDETSKGEAEHAETAHGKALTEDGIPVKLGAAAIPASDAQLADEALPAIAETDETANGLSEEAKAKDARTSKGDSVEKVSAPLIEHKADLAAGVEIPANPVDRGGLTEVASAEPTSAPVADASNGGSTTHRTAATLDRLAVTALRRNDEAAQTDGGPQIDRPRFVQRVEGALRAAQQRDGRIQVRLAPPELGVVHIELAVQNGVMTAKLEAETAAARNALLDNLPALRERLAEQNIRVEKFDVDVRRDPQQGRDNNAPGDRPDGQGESSSQGRRGRPVTTSLPAASKTVHTASSASNAGLDVRI